MKHSIKALISAGILSFGANAVALEPLDHIVAVANEDIVLNSELVTSVNDIKRRLMSQGVELPPLGILREQVLERLIVTRLQVQRASTIGITVDDEELNQTLESIAARNGLTLGQFAQALRADNMDYLQVRTQIRDELIVSQLSQREVESRILVTDQDVDLFLASKASDLADTEFRLAHLLIAIPDGADADSRKEAVARAERLRKEIADGKDFAEVAIANSDGQTALQGGDLGWRSGAALPTLFANVAPTLGVGEVSDVIETRSGIHLIKLLQTRGGEPRKIVKETRARHILLQANALRNENEARDLARELHQRIKNGESFEALAREYSDDKGSAPRGGELDWQAAGSFVPAFEQTLDALKPNEISDPFRSTFGWHIAQLIDRRQRDSTDQIRRARAREAIRQRKLAEEYELWIRRLRDEAYVEYRLEPAELPDKEGTPTTSDT